MSDAINKAKELGNCIIQSKEFIEYCKLKEKLSEKQLLDKAALYERAKMITESNKFTPNNKLYMDAVEIIESCKLCPEIVDYFKAKDKLALYLKAINQTLSHITGMDSETSCGGCGGCNGCR